MDLSDSKVRAHVNKRFRAQGDPVKACARCYAVKPHTEFGVRTNGGADGRQSRCLTCEASRTSAYHAANGKTVALRKQRHYVGNLETHRARSRQYQRDHPDVIRASVQRRRAVKAGVTVDSFTASDLRTDWEESDLWDCFFCGGPLSDGYDVEHFFPMFPDDEQSTPPGPHALWNLVPSCAPCNRGVNGKHSREPWQFLRESLSEQGVDLDACLTSLEAIAARRR